MHQSLQVRPSCQVPGNTRLGTLLGYISQEGRVTFSGSGEGRCLEAVAGEVGAGTYRGQAGDPGLLPGLCRQGEDRQRWTYRWEGEEGTLGIRY